MLKQAFFLLAWLLALPAFADVSDSLVIFSCTGEQVHSLSLQNVDDNPSVTYFLDATPVATASVAQGYADDDGMALYLPFFGTWYVFSEKESYVWANGNVDHCIIDTRPSDAIDPSVAGFLPVFGLLKNSLGL